MQFQRYMATDVFARELDSLHAFRGRKVGSGLLEYLEQQGLLSPRIRIRYPGPVARRFWLLAHEHWGARQLRHPTEPDGPRWEAAVELNEALYRWRSSLAYGPSDNPLDDPAPRFSEFIQHPSATTFEASASFRGNRPQRFGGDLLVRRSLTRRKFTSGNERWVCDPVGPRSSLVDSIAPIPSRLHAAIVAPSNQTTPSDQASCSAMSPTTTASSTPSSIKRSFRDLSDIEVADIERASSLSRMGWSGGFGWDELLRSQRVVMVSEAGAGKTYECQTQQARLWKAGEPAFFLELATLAGSSVRDMLTYDEEQRFEAWLRSQSEIATFFLDSYDELKLTLGSFEQALKRLNKALAGQLGRARIIVTTRPVPIDRELFAEHLPIPTARKATSTGEAFADIVMDRHQQKIKDETRPKPWRNVSLMPLSTEQMREFAVLQGVTDPDKLLADIRERDAEQFAERPQDLIELCSDWREHHRIRSHREQVESNIATKLKPRTAPKERVEFSQETAIEGSSRLALAALLTRKLTLRHSADADSVHASEAALDVSKILLDWSDAAQSVLLERALFGFASYGRVRFHHRSVLEFLAAKRLDALLARSVSIKSIKRLLFVETAQGVRTVRPSMHPVAAWLSLWHHTIFDDIVELDPAVVLDHGDPQSLSVAQRIRALEAYVERYGRGGWRGLSTPEIQVHRFASPELAPSVRRLWKSGIGNPEVRSLLLRIVIAGKLKACADIVYAIAMDAAGDDYERSLATEALVHLSDEHLEALAESLENEPARWPDAMARRALITLFPTHLSVSRLSRILKRVKQNVRSIGELNHRLPHEIEIAGLSPEDLDELRQALTDMILDGIAWAPDKYPHVRTKRYELLPALIATCRRQEAEGVRTEAWISSSLLAIRLSKNEHGTEREALARLRIAARARRTFAGSARDGLLEGRCFRRDDS
ncbi:hypothetical protein QRQ56_34835 [Bradyrhizobium sp. U531]|uniref:hypothetical protein n=1 Tax=Bradyrhizobium sp. U531 TaxID=3053458 RepID=UPI003F42DAF6